MYCNVMRLNDCIYYNIYICNNIIHIFSRCIYYINETLYVIRLRFRKCYLCSDVAGCTWMKQSINALFILSERPMNSHSQIVLMIIYNYREKVCYHWEYDIETSKLRLIVVFIIKNFQNDFVRLVYTY